VDEEYDRYMQSFFLPYHQLGDTLCRVAINHDVMTEQLVAISATLGCEAAPLHLALFPKLWLDISQAEQVDKKYLEMLCRCSRLAEYIQIVLIDERQSLANAIIFQFLVNFYPKVSHLIMTEQVIKATNDLVQSLISASESTDLLEHAAKLHLNIQVIGILFSAYPPPTPLPGLCPALNKMLVTAGEYLRDAEEKQAVAEAAALAAQQEEDKNKETEGQQAGKSDDEEGDVPVKKAKIAEGKEQEAQSAELGAQTTEQETDVTDKASQQPDQSEPSGSRTGDDVTGQVAPSSPPQVEGQARDEVASSSSTTSSTTTSSSHHIDGATSTSSMSHDSSKPSTSSSPQPMEEGESRGSDSSSGNKPSLAPLRRMTAGTSFLQVFVQTLTMVIELVEKAPQLPEESSSRNESPT